MHFNRISFLSFCQYFFIYCSTCLKMIFHLPLRSMVVAFRAAIWASLISLCFLRRFSRVSGRVGNILDICSAMSTLSYCRELLYIGNQTESQQTFLGPTMNISWMRSSKQMIPKLLKSSSIMLLSVRGVRLCSTLPKPFL